MKGNLELQINNGGVKQPPLRALKSCKKKKPREHRGKQFPNVNKKSFTMTGER